jgi:hypothetical protein
MHNDIDPRLMKPGLPEQDPSFKLSRRRDGEALLAQWAGYTKEIISQHRVSEVGQHLARSYRTLRLMNEKGEWTINASEEMLEALDPANLSLQQIHEFIAEICRVNQQNAYLMEFAGALNTGISDPVSQRIGLFADASLTEIVAFALLLQKLTAAFYLDVERVHALVTHWEREAAKMGLSKQLGFGFRIKFESIRTPIRRSRECVQSGQVPASFCNFILPFNILQASLFDLVSGNPRNARAGLVLARHLPGNKTDSGTGAGPVHLDQSGRIIESGLPLPEQWVDLYQSWNLAFGAQFSSFPFYLCKLVIPQVAGYHGHPQQYVWNRTHALMTYLYFAAFTSGDWSLGHKEKSSFNENEWTAFASAELRKHWGQINHDSARGYAKQVRETRRTWR